jgi:putative NIF3 family GTP cyclohydrolase 1 type 2
VLLCKEDINAALNAMKKAHPYEEPAFDLYPLLNKGNRLGLGRIGELPEPASLAEFAADVKQRLGARNLRFVGEPGRIVRKVALCGGSGAELLQETHLQGADLLITGDVKYHEARRAEALGLSLIDAGHFATERPMIMEFTERLNEELRNRGFAAEIIPHEGEREPFSFI